jgi:hypothetical protein
MVRKRLVLFLFISTATTMPNTMPTRITTPPTTPAITSSVVLSVIPPSLCDRVLLPLEEPTSAPRLSDGS